MAVVTCPTCGSPVREGDRFCAECGTAMPTRSVESASSVSLGNPPLMSVAVAPPTMPASTSSAHAAGYGAVNSWQLPAQPAMRPNGVIDAPAGVQPLLEYEVAYPERLGRLWLLAKTFVGQLILLPHLFVLALLSFVVVFATIVAWLAILVTGRYPRSLWDFTLSTLRWSANVSVFGSTLQRDDYPPFSSVASYPVRFQLDYPARLSRLLIFLKWLLVIPHFIVLTFLYMGLVVALFLAWFAILFAGRYPRGLFHIRLRRDALVAPGGCLPLPAHRCLPTVHPGSYPVSYPLSGSRQQ